MWDTFWLFTHRLRDVHNEGQASAWCWLCALCLSLVCKEPAAACTAHLDPVHLRAASSAGELLAVAPFCLPPP